MREMDSSRVAWPTVDPGLCDCADMRKVWAKTVREMGKSDALEVVQLEPEKFASLKIIQEALK